jgi:hypothetical protein
MHAVGVRFVGHHDEQTLRQAGAEVVVTSLGEVDAAAIVRLVG